MLIKFTELFVAREYQSKNPHHVLIFSPRLFHHISERNLNQNTKALPHAEIAELHVTSEASTSCTIASERKASAPHHLKQQGLGSET